MLDTLLMSYRHVRVNIMLTKKVKELFCIVVFLCCSHSGLILAAEYPFIAELLPPHLQQRVASQSVTLQVNSVSGPDDYFVSKIKLWDNSSPIRVCFFGGNRFLRKKIASIAMQWSQAGGLLPLDFGDLDNPQSCGSGFYHIRVGFQYKGYWSMVGTDSVNIAAQYEQSMNLSLFNVNPPPEPKFSRIVLHEFGHAIGLQHEHQGHKAKCVNEFNWDSIYSYLQGPPNYWSIDKINHNLKPRPSAKGDEQPSFDVKSIMLYSFPKSFYRNSVDAECYTAGNNMLSDGDKLAMSENYPRDLAKSAEVRALGLQAFNSRIDKLEISDIAKSVAKLSAARLATTDFEYELLLPSQYSNSAEIILNNINQSGNTLDYLDRFQLQAPEAM